MVDYITAFERLGLPDIVLWLLTFSITYGLLSHADLPKSKAARAMISFVLAFFVMFSAPAALLATLTKMGSALILTVLGILVFIVFLEAVGMRVNVSVPAEVDEKGEVKKWSSKELNIFQYYSKYFIAAFIIIAVLIFIASGGLNLLGWNISFAWMNTTTAFFLIAIIIAIFWLLMEKGEGKK
jgi:small-conductance mechanosensitive channel